MDIEFADLRVERERRPVLDVPSLLLRGGRTTAILGPNGSGKTTLLRVIAGLERPRAGIVRAGGAPIARGQHVGYVFQEQVFLRRTVRENVELGLKLRKVEPERRRRDVENAARLLGITHLLDRRADRLSGGEGRRVSLARALCQRAPLVLLDEPLEALDERTYSRLLDELPEVLAAFDATTVLVTHNRHEALRLAQDLVVLIDGSVRAVGEKREVTTNPRVAAVAEVLGYYVLEAGGHRVGVPPDGLKRGTGQPQFEMVVEHLLDLVASLDIVGRIGHVRVHVTAPPGSVLPAIGDRVSVYAERFCAVQ